MGAESPGATGFRPGGLDLGMSLEERIPFSRATVSELGSRYVLEALAAGHLQGGGPYTARCEELLAREVGAARALLTTSCTHALELSALLLRIEPGDEVIVPSFSFPTTVSAFALRGAKPVFVDCRRDTFNIDESLLEAALSERTRAIVVVHYGGVACEMDPILELAAKAGVAVIEDNAHGLFGSYRGRPLGSLGCLATQSFHQTKNFTSGEGGALLVNDAALVERAEILREKGTDRARFLRGQVERYTWIDLGSSYFPSDLLAALLLAQLERREAIQAERRRLWLSYEAGLGWVSEHGVALPVVPAHTESAYHSFHLLLPTPGERERLMGHLANRGIASTFHFQPLHLSAMGRKLAGDEASCPITEDVCERILRLPFYGGLSDAALERILEAVREFYAS